MKHLFVLLLLFYTCCCLAQTKERHVAKDGHVWYEIKGENSVGVIDDKGNVIIPLDRGYTEINYYSKLTGGNLVRWPQYSVKKGSKVGVCDSNGVEILEPVIEDALLIRITSDGLAYFVYIVDEKQGVVDMKGNIIISPIYELVIGHDTKAGAFYIVKLNGKEGVIDDHNRTVVEINHKDIFCSTNCFKDDLGEDVYYKVSNKLTEYAKNNVIVTNPNDVSDLYIKANALIEKNDYKNAIKVYDEIVKKSPNALAYLLRGKAYYKMGKYEIALENFRFGVYRDDCTPEMESAVEDYIISADSYMAAKAVKRENRWNNIISGMQTLGSTLQSISTGGTSSPSYSGSSTHVNDNNSNSSSKQIKCKECLGNGKCSGSGSSSRYHCHGSGKCYACNGKGAKQTAGSWGNCDVCNGSGKCKYCNGTGKCSKCNGTGEI